MIRSIGLVMMTIGLLILSGFVFAFFIGLIKSIIEALRDRDYFSSPVFSWNLVVHDWLVCCQGGQ